MALPTQDFDRVDRRKVHEHEDEHDDQIINIGILGSYVLGEESSGGPIGDRVTCSEMGK